MDGTQFWANLSQVLYRDSSLSLIPDKDGSVARCDICGSTMQVYSNQIHSNRAQYTRAWKCKNSQCNAIRHEHGMVKN